MIHTFTTASELLLLYKIIITILFLAITEQRPGNN